VSADAQIDTLSVRVCFDGAAPQSFGPGVAGAGRALLEARDSRGRALPTRGGRIDLGSLRPDDCMRYRVDLDLAIRASRFARRYGRDLVSSQGVWLWRDLRAVPAHGATLRFDMPEGIHANAPWPRINGVHQLGPSAFRRPGFVSFGRRPARIIERERVRARFVRLGDGWNISEADLGQWLTEAIDGISTVQGRFPVDDLLIVLVPTRGDSIGFAMVRRGGGHAAAFMVGRDARVETLRSSWVTWHELSHLHLPALPQEDAWLYEGVATYYQEILRVRLGIQTQEQAWAHLLDGFERGARGGARGSLRQASASLFSGGSFSRVYWAGTAFALEADVSLRRRGSSLDAALRRAGDRWRGDLGLKSGADVCATWDRPLDAQVLVPLRDRYSRRRGFPGTRSLLERLGVRTGEAGLALGGAELSRLRDAIMRR